LKKLIFFTLFFFTFLKIFSFEPNFYNYKNKLREFKITIISFYALSIVNYGQNSFKDTVNEYNFGNDRNKIGNGAGLLDIEGSGFSYLTAYSVKIPLYSDDRIDSNFNISTLMKNSSEDTVFSPYNTFLSNMIFNNKYIIDNYYDDLKINGISIEKIKNNLSTYQTGEEFFYDLKLKDIFDLKSSFGLLNKETLYYSSNKYIPLSNFEYIRIFKESSLALKSGILIEFDDIGKSGVSLSFFQSINKYFYPKYLVNGTWTDLSQNDFICFNWIHKLDVNFLKYLLIKDVEGSLFAENNLVVDLNYNNKYTASPYFYKFSQSFGKTLDLDILLKIGLKFNIKKYNFYTAGYFKHFERSDENSTGNTFQWVGIILGAGFSDSKVSLSVNYIGRYSTIKAGFFTNGNSTLSYLLNHPYFSRFDYSTNWEQYLNAAVGIKI